MMLQDILLKLLFTLQISSISNLREFFCKMSKLKIFLYLIIHVYGKVLAGIGKDDDLYQWPRQAGR